MPDTLVLETTFTTSTGTAVITDALVFDDNERGHGIGLDAPHVLVRSLECTNGAVPLEMEFAPRPEYGLVVPHIGVVDGGTLSRGGADLSLLAGPPPTGIHDNVARWLLELAPGKRLTFALQHHTMRDTPTRVWSEKQARKRVADTVKGWASWSAPHQRYQGPWMHEVHHSGRVLHALTYRPTGAIVAAATTSLPEEVGGTRNWDYRYCWLRDASMTLQALWIAACPDEAQRFLTFIARVAGNDATGIQIMFGVGGEHDLSERELDHLSGWRDSRPVRVGNGAWTQHQSDVFGAVLDAAYRFRDQITVFEPDTIELLVSMADTAATVWRHADQGIWEVRGERRHFVHSKLMCWVALDRAAALADQLGVPERAAEWAATADSIREAILERGWNPRVGAYTQSFESDHLDSSALLLLITGFCRPTTPACCPPSRSSPGNWRLRRACSTGTSSPTGCRAPNRRFCSAATGSPKPSPSPANSRRPARSSSGPLPTPTTSVSSPKKPTPTPATCSATSRKRSATSDSSTPRQPSTAPNAEQPEN